jgi:hypothetical protein
MECGGGTSCLGQSCLFPTIFRNLNSPGICSFHVDLYLVQKGQKSALHCHLLPIFFLNVITGLVGTSEAHNKTSKK